MDIFVNFYEIPYINYKKQIINTINENIYLERKEIVNILLKNLNVSISKLYDIFYYLFNMPINKYIDKIKIDKACYLLNTTNSSLTTISLKLNISEQALTKKFIDKLHSTPKNFKKQLSNNK